MAPGIEHIPYPVWQVVVRNSKICSDGSDHFFSAKEVRNYHDDCVARHKGNDVGRVYLPYNFYEYWHPLEVAENKALIKKKLVQGEPDNS